MKEFLMNMRNWTMTGVLCALMAMVVATSGCSKAEPDGKPSGESEAATGEHGADDGHGHADGQAVVTRLSIEERANMPCEHAVPIHRCDECRYEAGVVRVDASVLKRQDGCGLVQTQVVAKTRVFASLPATGEVVLNENTTAHISPRVAGVIDRVFADIGSRVKAGEALLTVTSVELGRALAEHERNRALTELSEKVLKRESKLREQNVGSEQDLIEAQMAFEQHRTELKASEQTLHVLGLTEDDLAAVRGSLHGADAGRLAVRAPFAGTVIEKHAVSGELAEPGKDVMVLSDLTTVWVWANVHSRDLAGLLAAERRGPVAIEISVAAFPDSRFSGKLDYIGATMNEETRTVKVRATVANPELSLRPGMFCEVSMALEDRTAGEVLAAPRSALFVDEGSAFVFRHWKDDFYIRQPVRAGREFVGKIEIVEGLQPGDIVITEGGFLLKSDVLREKMGAGCAD